MRRAALLTRAQRLLPGDQLVLQLHHRDVEHDHGAIGDPPFPVGNGALVATGVTRSLPRIVCSGMDASLLTVPAETSDATAVRAPRRVVVAGVAVGAVAGMAYGSVLRAWMRLVTTDPAFTWSGTGFIVGAFTLTGAMAGLVAGGRRRGWKAMLLEARIVGIVISMACFGAAGAVMLPTVVPGALALARSDWPRPARRVAGAIAALSTLMVVAGLHELSLARAAVATVLYWALVLVEIRIFAELHRPSVGHLKRPWKALAVTTGVALALGVTVLAVGIRRSGS